MPTAVPIVKAAEQPSANLTFGVFTVANSDSSVSDQPSPNSTSSKALEEKLIPLQFGDFVLSTTSHYGDAHEVKHEVPVKKEASVETPPTNGKKSFIEVN